MSLIDPRTLAYWRMDEQHDSVLPSDAAGNLADLAVPTGLTRPAVVGGTPGGFGRDFVRAGLTGLLVTDAAGVLRLTRGLTIVAMARLDVAALANGNTCALVLRGRGSSVDEYTFGLRVVVVSAAARTCRLEMHWMTDAGGAVVDGGVQFTWPEGEFLLLAGVRELVGGQLVVRYQLNGESFVSGTHALDVGGAASADVSVGMGMSGAAYQNHWDGVIDSLEILGEAVSVEEFAWTWERITTYIPESVEAIRRLQVRGVYPKDPTSRVQRELRVEGELAGHAKALSRRMRDYGLPDRAWGEVLAKWELITAHSPKPSDDLQTRRNRVLGFLGTLRGANPEDIRAVLEESFGLDSADIQILEYDNEDLFDFATTPTHGIQIQGNGNAWAVASGVLQARQTGSVDLRYGGLVNPRAMLWLRSLSSGVLATVAAKIDIVSTTSDALGGIVLGSRSRDEWVWIGTTEAVDGTVTLNWIKYKAGVLDNSFTQLATGVSDPLFLRATVLENGTIDVRWGSSDAAAKAAAPTNINPALAGIPEWTGLAAVAPNGDSAVNGSYDFDDLFIYTPNGDQRFNWFAYRNPALGGTYDLEGARAIVKRVKPAHTDGSACSVLAVVCGDVNNGCGQAPCG